MTVSAKPNEFRLLANGVEVEGELSAVLAGARKSICVMMYIFSNDESGQRILSMLVKAAIQGASVRVIIDAFGSVLTPDGFFARLREAGGEVHRFNSAWHPRYLVRNHQKFVIVDGSTAITGGFNIASHYFGDGIGTGWRETGIRVDGASVGDLQSYFDSFWTATTRNPPSLRVEVQLARFGRRLPKRARRVEWLVSGPSLGKNVYSRFLRKDLSRASQLMLMMGYFVPTASLRRLIGRIAHRGKVQIVLPYITDVPISRYAAWFTYARLLRDGCEIYEYQPRPLHAKLFVVDDIVYTGSANFDIRSLRVNYELSLRVQDAALAAEVRQLIEADIIVSHRITSEAYRHNSSIFQRLLRRLAYAALSRFDYFISRKLPE